MRGCADYPRRSAASLIFELGILVVIPLSSPAAQTAPPAAKKEKAAKPLAGYTSIVVEPFAVEKGAATKDFPEGEEGNLQLSAVAGLRASQVFKEVVDAGAKPREKPPASETAPPEKPRTVILSTTIIGFNKGSSGARFMTWPLPLGASKAKARFVFRDAESNQEVFRFEKEAKFQAALSGGIASKEDQLAHVKGSLVDALIKEIRRNR
jgi:hypothetical protein